MYLSYQSSKCTAFHLSLFSVSANFKSTVYYKDSVNLLRKYRPAIECLGEPILAGNIDFGSRGAVVADGFKAKVSITPTPCVVMGLRRHNFRDNRLKFCKFS